MKPKLTLLFALTITFLMTLGQRSAIELTFTAVDSTAYVQLDSIKIMNRTQGGETVLVWPDTVLSVLWVGVSEPEQISGFRLNQNYPNPVGDQTTINLTVPEQGQVNMMVTDLLGRTLYSRDFVLSEGTHALLFTPGKESTYFLSANWRGERQTIKILHYGAGHQKCLFKYTGLISSVPEKKLSAQAEDFIFNPGDELLYIGYAAGLESGMLDAPEQDSTYTFQFATNIPCPETPTVKYKGQVYNTIQIFSQCWLKENLNVGTMINGTIEQSNNGTIEKYCYNNEPDSCTKYGGLYQWNEMMQYTTQPGARGICPPGWQLPIDEEWKVLEGAVDSQYGIGDPEWDLGGGYRGFDAGTNLKTTQGWLINSGTDSFGFSGFPSGMRSSNGLFFNYGWGSYWWSSTGYYDYGAWFRDLNWQEQGVARFPLGLRRDGFSVRCLRDKIYIPLIELTFTAVNNATHVQLDSIKVMNRTQGKEAMLYGSDTTLQLPGEIPYTYGDTLLYVGYVNGIESGMLDAPQENTTYTFQFATNIPCPETPTVEYEDQVYNTIQIFSQCWLKENLNVGEMILGEEEMTDNGVMEKYCYNNEPDSCSKYGGLYQWWEMMQYITQQGVQGICPLGWHLPTDEEWKVLEGAVDSQYGIGDPEWDIESEVRGYDAGMNLKTTRGWIENGNGTDLFGFSGLPGGFRLDNGNFGNVTIFDYRWTSTEDDNYVAWCRILGYYDPESFRGNLGKNYGFSIRCLRDE